MLTFQKGIKNSTTSMCVIKSSSRRELTHVLMMQPCVLWVSEAAHYIYNWCKSKIKEFGLSIFYFIYYFIFRKLFSFYIHIQIKLLVVKSPFKVFLCLTQINFFVLFIFCLCTQVIYLYLHLVFKDFLNVHFPDYVHKQFQQFHFIF